ncbi:uncharacterized protein LOC118412005 [Branchiostoma floridae]|uniref:Uncharacterized protein LOC118412005 n=1 Tax=Branchiostoma floridae TaxID=7739 RepID=A0A9J7KUA1_BRAFL|nr:uncharacterized protein LOC118412005 [Branchiostoma floridae]
MAMKAFHVLTFATALIVVLSVMSSVWAEEEEEENFLPVDERSAEEEEATLEELLADILARLRGNEEEKRGLGKFGRRPLRQCRGNSMCKIFYGSRPKTICSCPRDTECMAPPNSRFKYRCM